MGTVADRGTTVFLSSHIVSELEQLCDYIIILSDSRVRVMEPTETLVSEHSVLVGARSSEPPQGIGIISREDTGRQTSMLVRGEVRGAGPEWDVLRPSLDEIVLAYLAPDSVSDADDQSQEGAIEREGQK
jgi:ABC-2 type transport system ATP-binding protein